MSVINPIDKLIRKLRKKLRQIERLELLGRSSLNEEELLKVKQKNATRAELAQLLKQVGESSSTVTPNKINKIQKTSTISLVEGSNTTTSLTTVKPSQNDSSDLNETEKNHSPFIVDVQKEVKSVKSTDKSQNLTTVPPTVFVEGSSPDKMKRSSSSEETETASSPESSINKTQQAKKSKPDPLQEQKINKSGMNNETNQQTPAIKAWHETPFVLNSLEAHSDIVCCVDLDENYIISGSRDTLVQVWCAKTGSSLMNLRGHTNTVTCVSLLSSEDSKTLKALICDSICEDPRLALTASLDCCLKLWNIENGVALRSIYTFSGVTALCYLPVHQCCIVGSEGGKLEVYTFHEEISNPVFSIKTFESSITSIKLQGENLIVSSLDGFISVWGLKGTELCRLYQSDDLVSENCQALYYRPILSLAVSPALPTSVFYGDEGANVKMLTWKSGFVKKLRNHVHDFGITNAIYATKSFLLSSSINLDTGNSSVNVRSTRDLSYLGTLNISGAGRIVCIAATEDKNDQSLRLVIGGTKLTLLETRGIGCRRSPKKDSLLKPQLMKDLSLPVEDSEGESSSSEELEEDQEEDFRSNGNDLLESTATSSWCSFL